MFLSMFAYVLAVNNESMLQHGGTTASWSEFGGTGRQLLADRANSNSNWRQMSESGKYRPKPAGGERQESGVLPEDLW
jgi:hypothetical protein